MIVHPIVIVEDDDDDADLLKEAFAEVCMLCECRRFTSPVLALEYLKTTEEIPLVIISDINMPLMNGLEFKRRINEDVVLSGKSIPFVFLSTAVNPMLVTDAFSLSIQGFFKKPDNITDLDIIARSIVDYWTHFTILTPTGGRGVGV